MVPACQSNAIIIIFGMFLLQTHQLGCIHLLKLAVRKLESKMNKHADRVTGEGFVTMRAPKQCEKNLVKF